MSTAGLVYIKGQNNSTIAAFRIQPDGYPSWVIPGLTDVIKGIKNPHHRVAAIREVIGMGTTEMRIDELNIEHLAEIQRNETSFNYIYEVGTKGGITPFKVEPIYGRPISELKKMLNSKTKFAKPEDLLPVDYKIVKVTKSKDKDSLRYW